MLTECTSDYQSFAIVCFKEGNAAEKLNLCGSEGVSFTTLAADCYYEELGTYVLIIIIPVFL